MFAKSLWNQVSSSWSGKFVQQIYIIGMFSKTAASEFTDAASDMTEDMYDVQYGCTRMLFD